jgi:hypothetical protein
MDPQILALGPPTPQLNPSLMPPASQNFRFRTCPDFLIFLINAAVIVTGVVDTLGAMVLLPQF